jgi:hypothetical protein
MKKKYLIVLVVLALVLAACANSTGGGDGTGGPATPTDDTPNVIPVPSTVADIDGFDSNGGSYVENEGDAATLIAAAMLQVEGLVEGIVSSRMPSQYSNARSVQEETIDIKFSQYQEEIRSEIPGANVLGFASGTVRYDDINTLPISVNLNMACRAEILGRGYTSGGYTVKTTVGGTAGANFNISENDTITGSARADFQIALSVTDGRNWVKCYATATLSFNAGNIAYSYSAKAFKGATDSASWTITDGETIPLSEIMNM